VNLNKELGFARQSQERKEFTAVSNPEAAGSSSGHRRRTACGNNVNFN
jgi:hypothetical protein